MLRFAVLFALAVIGGLLLWQWRTILRVWRRRANAERDAIEDALKHIHAQEIRGRPATRESVAGALGIPLAEAMQHLVTIYQRGLLRHAESGLELTDEGRALALQIIRAHRLLERYFADELRMPVDAVHAAADRDEHALSPSETKALDMRLGYPRRDPHGDPIPTAAGAVAVSDAMSLDQWPTGLPAEIVHLEDEPADVFRDITKSGLKLAMTVEILDRTDHHIVVWDGECEHLVPVRAADNVSVRAARRPRVSLARLSDLTPGESAIVSDLECEGFGRRRLLDLGVTPGTRVDCLFVGLAPEPMAYRIRGAVIALRREQAAEIVIERTEHRTEKIAAASPGAAEQRP